ncbi:MAG: RNA 3'-terminal phosphate cyclase [Candidatus Thermoplasmatota archaeon]|nr:RNA 3'-terminal phosphate cyclase [Candidatus Thermoplasmatota archaeon]MBU1940835.1 RNA 3'-terminal phosphate cyclase [Candidatus Thermoplasmatota archaeon]
MHLIDGSYGEGGGQILRYATALSTCTQKPIHLTNIRAKRSIPGLRPQHFAAISILQSLCNADTTGLAVGSEEITYVPKKIDGTSTKYDIGTAGSLTLVYQAILLALYNLQNPIQIELTGGTDVRWSPSWDYFEKVFLTTLKKLGITTKTKILQRGYYPQGGGVTQLSIMPPTHLHPIEWASEPRYPTIEGTIHIANLPDQIATRIQHAVIKYAVKHDLNASVQTNRSTALSPGVCISLWAISNTGILGVSHLGEKGISAETVGTGAITKLHRMISHGATVDNQLFDQILPYMALQEKPSRCRVENINEHAKTTIWLLQQFFDIKIEFSSQESFVDVMIKRNKTI